MSELSKEALRLMTPKKARAFITQMIAEADQGLEDIARDFMGGGFNEEDQPLHCLKRIVERPNGAQTAISTVDDVAAVFAAACFTRIYMRRMLMQRALDNPESDGLDLEVEFFDKIGLL